MMELDAFKQLIEEIMAQGHDEETAARYAALIGDTPNILQDGTVVVRERDGREVARLKPLKFFAG